VIPQDSVPAQRAACPARIVVEEPDAPVGRAVERRGLDHVEHLARVPPGPDDDEV
jgi:hypothetical protein